MLSIRFRGFWVVALSILLCCAAARAELPIEGNRAVIQTALAAQQTNIAQLARGLVEARVELTRPRESSSADVLILWSGDNTYLKYAVRSTSPSGSASAYAGESIRTQTRQFDYNEEARIARIALRGRSGHDLVLTQYPREAWFHWNDMHPLSDVLNPDFRPSQMSKGIVREPTPDTFQIEYHAKEGYIWRFNGSWAKAGNITSYESVLEKSNHTVYRGTFDWQQHQPSGRWYVPELMWERISPKKGLSIDMKMTMKVTRFEPEPEFPSGRFTFESLKLIPGTTVEEYAADGTLIRSRQIPKTDRITEAEFQALGAALRASPFARGNK